MSNYRMRQSRHAWKRQRAAMTRELEACRLRVRHAEYKAEAANYALAKSGYNELVRWGDVSLPVHVGQDRPRQVPCVHLKLMAQRRWLDASVVHRQGAEAVASWLERDVADQIARYLIENDIVSIERAKVPMSRDPNTFEYDFAVYVGTPVRKDP